MTPRSATWKIVAFGTALTGLGLAGAGVALADDDRGPAAVPAGVSVPAGDSRDDAGPFPADAPADASPENADSPAESPDDAGADSPDRVDSAATPDDGDQGSADSPDNG